MRGSTHAVAGLMLGTGIVIHIGSPPPDGLILIGVTVLGALAADIDTPWSSLRRRLGWAGVVFMPLRHRGLTHTLLMLLLVAVLVAALFPLHYSSAFLMGYLSHLFLDLMTRSGLRLFWPLPCSCHLLPAGRRITTGGTAERLLGVVIGLLAMVLLLHLAFVQYGLLAGFQPPF